MKKFDVFLSYQWDVKPSVMKLYEKLTDLGLRVWMDQFEIGTSRLVDGFIF
jgi:hypothetical protein